MSIPFCYSIDMSRTKWLQIRVTAEEKRRVDKFAKDLDTDVAHVVRTGILFLQKNRRLARNLLREETE